MSESFTLDGVEANSFDDVPAGTYVGLIENTVVGDSNGHATLRCQFKIVDGDQKGRVISDWLHFTQNAAGVVLTKISAAGVEPPTGLTTGDQWATRLRDLLGGHHATIVVTLEEYPKGSGTFSTKVKAWKTAPAEFAGRKPVGSAGGSDAPVDEEIPF